MTIAIVFSPQYSKRTEENNGFSETMARLHVLSRDTARTMSQQVTTRSHDNIYTRTVVTATYFTVYNENSLWVSHQT